MTVTAIDKLRILELMAENKGFEPIEEDDLEKLLDQEADEEFGLPEFRDHFADSLTPAVLKDWTAKDFASIYVRFRPHLERHARRYLQNPSQVEEVVQDAFLYLMTSLPELDSELGVLKFLKWKTRLLALDVIRSNSRASFSPIEDDNELVANSPELSLELERADDAAIVSLALAKLQPRQREALIATLYQEKTPEVVAAQMGLSDNAFRQLLFRARGAFRTALVGEAETQGMRVSEILSLAARKAAKESGKLISAAGAFLIVMALSVGLLPRLMAPDVSETEISLPAGQNQSAPAPESAPPAIEAEEPATDLATGSANDPGTDPATDPASVPALVEEPASGPTIVEAAVVTEPIQAPAVEPTPVFSTALFSTRETFGNLLTTKRVSQLNAKPATTNLSFTELGENRVYNVANGSGLSALIEISKLNLESVQFSRVDLNFAGLSLIAMPQASGTTISRADGLTTYFIGLSDFVLASNSEKTGNYVWDNTSLGDARVRIVLTVDETGKAVSGVIDISSR